MARAPKGGCIGINSEKYEGGQFLPSTTLPKMGRKKRSGPRKEQVAPFQWAEIPEGMRSIFVAFGGSPRALIENNIGLISVQTAAYYGLNLVKLAELAERWHQGERWISEEEFKATTQHSQEKC